MSDAGTASADGVIAPGNVAVVTGAASGIGFGLAKRFAHEGMKVVLADVEEPALQKAVANLREDGHRVTGVPTDVSDLDQVYRLREAAVGAYGAAHLVCNNAGVSSVMGVPTWVTSRFDWDWIMGVNFGGVLNGVITFTPLLIDQPVGYIVNTASIAGAIAGFDGPYGVSKHAIVALTESLSIDLQGSHPHVGVSVLMPGGVETQLGASARNRPPGPDRPEPTDAGIKLTSGFRSSGRKRMSADEVAERVVQGIRTNTFYILTHPEWAQRFTLHTQEIVDGRRPAYPFGHLK
ncbi:MAG: SDR family NAD(P)-dependent oxidoreductase [Acidimicrobiales bacterium]